MGGGCTQLQIAESTRVGDGDAAGDGHRKRGHFWFAHIHSLHLAASGNIQASRRSAAVRGGERARPSEMLRPRGDAGRPQDGRRVSERFSPWHPPVSAEPSGREAGDNQSETAGGPCQSKISLEGNASQLSTEMG